MKNFLEKVQKNGPAGRKKKDKTERVTRLGRRTRDSKVESNDSHEIPDGCGVGWGGGGGGETSDIPGLPSRVATWRKADRICATIVLDLN